MVLSPLAVSDEWRFSASRESDGERGWLLLTSEASEVGDMDGGDEGRVESLETDTEEMEGGEWGGKGMS